MICKLSSLYTFNFYNCRLIVYLYGQSWIRWGPTIKLIKSITSPGRCSLSPGWLNSKVTLSVCLSLTVCSLLSVLHCLSLITVCPLLSVPHCLPLTVCPTLSVPTYCLSLTVVPNCLFISLSLSLSFPRDQTYYEHYLPWALFIDK